MLYLHHTSSSTHDPRALSPEHPDSPLRIQAIENAIAESTLPPLTRLSAPAATFDELRLVHSHNHIEAIRAVCERGGGQIDDDTGEPLGECLLDADSFGAMTCHVRDLAAELHAPVGAVLEGGYEPAALGSSVVAMLAALSGEGDAESIAPDQIVTPRVASHLGHA